MLNNTTLEQKIIRIDGLSCPACEHRIERSVQKLTGVTEINVSYTTSAAYITYDPNKVTLDGIYQSIERAGYTVILISEQPQSDTDEPTSYFTMLLIGLILLGLYIIMNNTIGFNFFPQVTQSMGYGMLFVAGLFTSVHCIAMCGGINLSQCAGYEGSENSGIYHKLKPSLLYNLGRVTSYTLLGGIVGTLGSVISISTRGKALVSLVAGIFMVIMGINMLGVFLPLRKFIPRLPKNLTLKLSGSRQGKAPFIVGLLNGLMPCGPLQAMQLYALGTGRFFTGALSMFLFSLGTVPLMFCLGAFSSLMNSRFTKQMMKISAILVIILGLVMGNRGFSLAGINPTDRFISAIGIRRSPEDATNKSIIKDDYQTITTNLESGRYQPIMVYANIPVKWTILAEKSNLNGCNNEIIIPNYQLQQKLKPGENMIEFTPTQTGTISYTCWMGMISSKIIILESPTL